MSGQHSEPTGGSQAQAPTLEELTGHDPAFRRLDVPVPPMLEAAIGYSGPGRFVAFTWGAGDEAYLDDGQLSATANGEPYLLFRQHRAVWPGLAGYDFGSEEAPAEHFLLLDRLTRLLYAVPARTAGNFLIGQWPDLFTPELLDGRWMAGEDTGVSRSLVGFMGDLLNIDNFEEVEQPGTPPMRRDVDIEAAIAGRRRLTEELAAWLDALPDDGRAAALTEMMYEELERSIKDGTPFTPPFR